jgi:hypothetical protein
VPCWRFRVSLSDPFRPLSYRVPKEQCQAGESSTQVSESVARAALELHLVWRVGPSAAEAGIER